MYNTPPKTSVRASTPPPLPPSANPLPSHPSTPAAQVQIIEKAPNAPTPTILGEITKAPQQQVQNTAPSTMGPPVTYAPPTPQHYVVEEPPEYSHAVRHVNSVDEETRRQLAAAAAAEAKAKHDSFVAEQVRLMAEHERRQAEARLAEEMRIKEQLNFQLEEGGKALQRQREILDMENRQRETALQLRERDVEAQQAKQREEARLELQRQQMLALRLQQERDLEAQRAKQREEAELELQHQQLLMFRQQQEQQRLWDVQQSQNQISYQQPSYQYQNQWQPTHFGPPYMNQSSGPPPPSQQTSPPIPSSQHVQPPGLQNRFRRLLTTMATMRGVTTMTSTRMETTNGRQLAAARQQPSHLVMSCVSCQNV